MSIYYNNDEAKNEKKPNNYQNFTYDNETNGGCLNKFADITKIIGLIYDDILTLGTKYSQLQTKFNAFTDFNEKMTSNKNSLIKSFNDLKSSFNLISKNLSSQVQLMMKQDSSFIGDLEKANTLMSYLNNNNNSSEKGIGRSVTIGSDKWNSLPNDVKESLVSDYSSSQGKSIQEMSPVKTIRDIYQDLGKSN